ncbi:MAG: hypothetical protein NVSMB18_03520 [Acetobacteraceae bacterium]
MVPHTPVRRPDNASLVLALLLLAFVLVNGRWILLYRQGQPLDIDEAGYLGIALGDYYGLVRGGLLGWLQAVEAPSIQAPVTTVLASLVFGLVGPHVVAGFVVPLIEGAVTVWASYALARRMASPGAALAAAGLVASCPMISNYSRSFHFAMAATAVLTLALLCALRSRRFASLGWSSLFGICVGLLPLARTMAIAFLPGLILGAVVILLGERRCLRGRIALFCGSMALAALTAASWLWWNGSYVFAYLFSYGYGSRATEFGPKQSPLGFEAWMSTAQGLVSSINVPHSLVLVMGLAAGGILVAVTAARRGGAGLVRAVWMSPALPVLICVGAALAALTSSQNKGSAFVAPILPAALVLSVGMVWRVAPARAVRWPMAGLGLVVSAIATVASLDAAWDVAAPRTVVLPGWGSALLSDGRGTIQLYEFYGGFNSGTPALPLPPAEGAAWIAVNDAAAALLKRAGATATATAFGFRHTLFNVNTVRLQSELADMGSPPLVQIDPALTGTSVEGYEAWLTRGDAQGVCLLLSWQGARGELPIPVVTAALEEAARRAGFTTVHALTTPDGDPIKVWARSRVGSGSCLP